MGRQFRALRLARTVKHKLDIPFSDKRSVAEPPWLKVLEAIPPAEILTRPIPAQLQTPDSRLKKPRNTFRPQRITYKEDRLRKRFFMDHPWELARPRVIVESDGKDARRCDWSTGLLQPGIPLTGECVVQRQLWLMNNKEGITENQAYDQARKEFYRLRQEEEVGKRIAVEEARMVGAYFGKTRLQVGMKLEDEQFERWKAWATEQTSQIEAERSAATANYGLDDPNQPIPELDGETVGTT